MIDRKKQIFSILPHFLKLPLAKAYCNRKKKRIQDLETPVALVFFITSRCNLRCSHCFYWQELNSGENELSIGEIEKVASSFKHPVWLSLTGGEPFLRDNLAEIARIFNRGCGTREIGITTNGTLVERTVETVLEILESGFLDSLSVQVSLDGLEGTHDAIRGVKGSFKKAILTIKELKKIGTNYPGFQLKTALTVQKRNLSELNEFVESLLPLKIPLRFNIVRGGEFGVFDLPANACSGFDPKDESNPFLSLAEIKGAYSLLKEMSNSSKFHFWPARQQKIWELSIQMLEKHKCDIPCYAARMESVLYSDGHVSFCELSKPFSNIREFGYDFARLWKSRDAATMRKLISRCCCIHGCNLTTGLTFEPEMVVSVLDEQEI